MNKNKKKKNMKGGMLDIIYSLLTGLVIVGIISGVGYMMYKMNKETMDHKMTAAQYTIEVKNAVTALGKCESDKEKTSSMFERILSNFGSNNQNQTQNQRTASRGMGAFGTAETYV